MWLCMAGLGRPGPSRSRCRLELLKVHLAFPACPVAPLSRTRLSGLGPPPLAGLDGGHWSCCAGAQQVNAQPDPGVGCAPR